MVMLTYFAQQSTLRKAKSGNRAEARPLRIKLITPRMTLRPMDSEYKRRMSPSLALLTVAALTPERHTVVFEDENVRPIDYDAPADLVGITVNVDTSWRAYGIAGQFRERGVPVVLGGIHASANPDEALAHADAVCVGEAEGQWDRILRDAAAGHLRGRYENAAPARLALSPIPRRDLAGGRGYLYTNIVSASRGCPFDCEFCYNSAAFARHGHRTRPIGRVIEDIRSLGRPHVFFIDDNLIGNLAWARELVAALRPLGLTWHAAVSANIVEHEDLLDDMAEAGCKTLFIGFESINADALRAAKKHQNRAYRYERLIDMLHSRAIMVNASLVFGFDEDGPDVFARTLDWLVAQRIETMTAHVLTPYPGTRLFLRLKDEGRIHDFDWRHYNTSNAVFHPKQMTAEELRAGYLWMYRQFYSMENILRRLPQERSLLVPYLLFNLGYRKCGWLTAPLARLGLMNALGQMARRIAYGAARPALSAAARRAGDFTRRQPGRATP